MKTDKEVKKEFKAKASKDPEKYYATSVLKEEGYIRKKCLKSGTWFWSTDPDRTFCGDPEHSGGFQFFKDNPAKNRLDYIELWKTFAKHFKKRGYTPIDRYPVAARWRDDTDFVQASIYDFQPYVVKGEVEPPANPLVIPQFVLRFNDIDNVGITGSHYTGFVMIGQHAFVKPEDFDQVKYFRDIHSWLTEGIGLPKKEIIYQEDAWAGGGNFGPCMEFFSRGLELGNQVYMKYEKTPSGYKELDLNVLDMGMGHERNAWFTQGTSTSYETTFPTVVKKLTKSSGYKIDNDVFGRFLPYSSYLNVDEVENIEDAWQDVAKKLSMDAKDLRETILPLSQLFSIGEHARTLLVAFADGVLPSNVGGGYNLRLLYRRAMNFINTNEWNIEMADIFKWHADYLKPLFPELKERVDSVMNILDSEKRKYDQSRERSRLLINKLAKTKISTDKLIELYDSQGINPHELSTEAKKQGVDIRVPDNFFKQVAERHETVEEKAATQKDVGFEVQESDETKARYYEDYEIREFRSKVKRISGKNVILEETYFYPTSGGQIHDLGILGKHQVIDVIKSGQSIVHVLADNPEFHEGDEIKGVIDFERREQLAKHHTATHVVNAAAKDVLGPHANQAGAKKTLEKATLDITHYDNIDEKELKKIEEKSNKLVNKGIPVESTFMSRTEAEKKFGTTIYQGGAVPGKTLRIVNILGTDVEACGGTHVKNTKEIGKIKILKASKIQDGIVRLTFVAGKAAENVESSVVDLARNVAKELDCKNEQIPGRADELFTKWKKVKKLRKQKQEIPSELLTLDSEISYPGDVLKEAARILKTQPEHIINTIQRFKKDLLG